MRGEYDKSQLRNANRVTTCRAEKQKIRSVSYNSLFPSHRWRLSLIIDKVAQPILIRVAITKSDNTLKVLHIPISRPALIMWGRRIGIGIGRHQAESEN